MSQQLPATYHRLVKEAGFGNVVMREAPMPDPGPDQVLVQVKRSLISRGSELLTRYMREEAVSPDVMGYSTAGDVVALGPGVTDLHIGDRVTVNGPHAQYLLANLSGRRIKVAAIPDALSYEAAAFVSLSTSALMWSRTTPLQHGEVVTVLGQGLVGALYAQTVREREPRLVIVVDAQALRCRIAGELGADHVVDATKEDPVSRVRQLSGGVGADAVVECVGGVPGLTAFEQAQQMLAPRGVIHLIGKYQGGPLPLHGDSFMDKRLVAGIRVDDRDAHSREAAAMLADGRIRVAPMITHRMSGQQTPDAYHLLYNSPDQALAVVLSWD